MKICYRGQQVFLKSAESQRKNKTAKRRSKFSQGTRYLPLTKQLPDETYMRVKVEPAKYTVEEHHICVYAGKTTDKIVKAFRPKSLLRNSIATPFPRCEYNEREICKWDAP